MNSPSRRPRTLEDLQTVIRTAEIQNQTYLPVSSQTSTVIPFEHLDLQDRPTLLDLTGLPARLKWVGDSLLHVQGPVTWKEAKEFAESEGQMILTSPTEELASMLAGIATSATGERCFGFGNLRSQIRWVRCIDGLGRWHELSSKFLLKDRFLKIHSQILRDYDCDYQPYAFFKNAPFPRFETECDLVTGTEGQLGIVTEAIFQTRSREELKYFFVKLPRWEQNLDSHLQMNTVLQGLRDSVWAAEFVDSNGMRFVPPELQLEPDFDILFLEARESSWETVIETLLQTGISDENIFELTETKYHAVRKAVPRGIFEANSRAGVSKQGTDVQVHTKDFQKILEKYQEAAQIGIPYTLFGHFGDSHLHFNFNLNPGQETLCHSFFESLYTCAREWGASPFAEHGIGYLKKPFILPFYHSSQKKLFQILKNEFDPHRILFPQGFMS